MGKPINNRRRPDKTQKKEVDKFIKDSNETLRLNKILAEAGVCSRRKADELIASGAVSVNGAIIIDLGSRARRSDLITVNGDPIQNKPSEIYILLNKPKDYITTTNDEKGRKTVMDLVKKRNRIYPVGRLDRNTTGVLLMTNDGELANRLTHPKYHINRLYIVGLDKDIKLDHAAEIAQGLELEDYTTSPCEVFVDPKDHKKISVSLHEGKNHEVRNMFEYFGYRVKKLDRKEFAGLTTSGLARGQYRHLGKKEVIKLKKSVGL